MKFKDLLHILDPDSEFMENDPDLYIRYWDNEEVKLVNEECITFTIDPDTDSIIIMGPSGV